MPEGLAEYFAVFSISMVKFVFGPLTGASIGLTFLESVLLTVGGMMGTVLFLALVGSKARKKLIEKFAKNRKKFTPQSRKIVKIWRKYGAEGISFLTPILFSPIIGTLIVITFGERKERIIRFMLFSACFWSVVLNAVVFFIGKEVITRFIVQ